MLLRSSAWNLSGWILSVLLAFVSSALYVRLLGAEHYGLMALLYSIVAPLAALDFGLGDATTKYVAESVARGRNAEVGQFVSATFVFNLGAGIVGAIAILGFSNTLVENVFRVNKADTRLAVFCLAMVALIWLANQSRQAFVGALAGVQRYDIINSGMLSVQVVSIGVGLALLNAGLGLPAFFVGQAAIAASAVPVWLLLAKRYTPGLVLQWHLHADTLRKSFHFGGWQTVNNLGGIASQQSQRWLIGGLLSVAEVGYYSLSWQLTSVGYLVGNRLSGVLFPAVSTLIGTGRYRDAADLVTRAGWLVSAVALPILCTLGLLAGDIVRIWVGNDIAVATTATTRGLAVASCAGVVFCSANSFMLGAADVRPLALLSVSQGLLSILLYVTAIPLFGIDGAGWAYAGGTVAHLVTLFWLWRARMQDSVSWGRYFGRVFSPYIASVAVIVGLSPVVDHWGRGLAHWEFGVAVCACLLGSLAVIVIARIMTTGGVQDTTDALLELRRVVCHIIRHSSTTLKQS